MPEQTPLEIAVSQFITGTFPGTVTVLPSDVGTLVYLHVNGAPLAIEVRRVVSRSCNGVRIDWKAGYHPTYGLFITEGKQVVEIYA